MGATRPSTTESLCPSTIVTKRQRTFVLTTVATTMAETAMATRTAVSSTSQRWRGVHLMSPFTLTTAKLVALYVRRPVLAESTVAGDQTHALRVPPSFTKVSWRRLITATTAAAPITYACTRNRSGHRDTTTVTRTATF